MNIQNIKTHVIINQIQYIEKCSYQNIENVGINQDIKISSPSNIFLFI